MFTFVKVKNSLCDYGYVLKITDYVSLHHYEQARSNGYAEAFADGLKVATGEAHARTDVGHSAAMLANLRGGGYIESFVKLVGDRFQGMEKALSHHGTIYVQRVGSYMVSGSDTEEYGDIVESEIAKWPQEKLEPRYIQWTNGSHWYVKYGTEDVSYKDDFKWNSYAEAEKAFKRWIAKREKE